MKIAVYGSAAGKISKKAVANAQTIGKEIASLGHTIITGACIGLPYEAAKSAYNSGGKSIGFSPAVNLEEHKKTKHPTDVFTELIFVPQNYRFANDIFVGKKYRNVESVATTDVAIIIGGRIGTMNEFTNAYDLGKNIGVLEGSGGISNKSIKSLLKEAEKESKSKVIFESDPQKLVKKLVETSS